MLYHCFGLLIFCLIVVHDGIAQQTADKSANAKTKQILAYITDLPKQGKVLSGQFAGYSPDTFSTDLIDQIAGQTGQVPAILGCDWACGWIYRSPPESIIDYSCNPSLKAHWNKGGLVTVNMHLPNPSSSTGGGYKDRGSLNFADLINRNSETGQRWYRFLDRMAQGLDDLQRAGVTVLFRPLHEMNGDWFYWCNQDSALFKNVWKHMFDYLTQTKQIHNLLWVYSPDQSRSGPARYYPGDAYVDIVALDVYTDDPDSMNGYSEMLTLNKPFALGEVGPGNTNGKFDYTRWISAIQSRFPRVAYFLAWNDGWSPIRNVNAYAFFNNPRLINRAQINLGNAATTSTSASSISSILYSFSQGVGQWKGSNLAGGPWQSNEFIIKGLNSLKADIRLSSGQRYTLFTQDSSALKINGKKRLTCDVRVASWGFPNGGTISTKLYLKGGSSWKWYDSGATTMNSGNTKTLVFDLSKVSSNDLADVKEIGVEFLSNTNGDQTSIYVSSFSVES